MEFIFHVQFHGKLQKFTGSHGSQGFLLDKMSDNCIKYFTAFYMSPVDVYTGLRLCTWVNQVFCDITSNECSRQFPSVLSHSGFNGLVAWCITLHFIHVRFKLQLQWHQVVCSFHLLKKDWNTRFFLRNTFKKHTVQNPKRLRNT